MTKRTAEASARYLDGRIADHPVPKLISKPCEGECGNYPNRGSFPVCDKCLQGLAAMLREKAEVMA